jgi:hypothetical protein
VRDFVGAQCAGSTPEFETVFRRALQFSHKSEQGETFVPLDAPEYPFMLRGATIPLAAMRLELLWRDLVAYELLRAMGESTDAVVELGSGWSANIFNLWLRGAPRQATYVGAELTAAGRKAAASLAALRPTIRYVAAPFDWSNPDFDFIPSSSSHVLVYSCHSVEQVPELKAELMHRLLDRTAGAKSVRGVFIEPVGWQFPEFAQAPDIVARTGEYCRRQNYNVNLRQTLEALGDAKRIEVLTLDLFSFGTDINPSTVIHWRRL